MARAFGSASLDAVRAWEWGDYLAALEDTFENPPIHKAFLLAFGGGKKTEPTWDLSTPEGRNRYLDSLQGAKE